MNEDVRVMALLGAITVSLCWADLRSASRALRAFRIASAAWMWLVLSEAALLRTRPAEAALLGEFAVAAHGEALTWVLLALFLAVVAIRWPAVLSSLFKPPLVWALCFAVLATLSSLWSESPLYSLAWSGKLLLVMVVLGALATVIAPGSEELLAFLRLACTAFFIASVLPFGLALADAGAGLFWSDQGAGRFGSIGTSEASAVAMMFSVALGHATGAWILYGVAGASFFIMLIGLGKAAIIAGVVSLLLYTALTRGRAAIIVAVGCAFAAAVMAGLVRTTPELGTHLIKYYEQGNVANISGRLPLWRDSMDPIREQWLIGHGYVSSRFLFTKISTWQTALPTSLHNATLEILYNNGVLGLALLTGLHASTVRRLWRGRYYRRAGDAHNRIAYALALSLYVGSLINGATGVYFGGAPHKSFILFLTSVAVVQILTASRLCERRAHAAILSHPLPLCAADEASSMVLASNHR